LKESLYYTKSFRLCRRNWTSNSPIRKKCFDDARIKDGDLWKWKCAKCGAKFAYSECQCDHISPVGTNSPQTKEEYMIAFEKQEVGLEGLQILCKKCHKEKTKSDTLYEKKLNLITYITNFCEKNLEWCPPLSLKLDVGIKCLQKMEVLIKKISDDSYDKIKKEKHKKSFLKLISEL
jgi:hypothetical protein